MDIEIIPKGNKKRLNDYLTHSEIQCRCSYSECTRTLVLLSTATSFYLTRKAYGRPVRVNSGFRCQKHNKDVGGRENSFHQIGFAIDIMPEGAYTLGDLNKLDDTARLYFDVVLRYDNFLHCHNLDDSRIIGEMQ